MANESDNSTAKAKDLLEKGGHRLQEHAQKARDTALLIATKVVHSAQETAQKVVSRAKAAATAAEHRREERTHATADKTKEQ